MRRLVSALLLLALCLPFAACSKIERSYAVRYGNFSVSKGIFQYLCASEKTNYLYEVYGLNQDTVAASQLQDNAAIWAAQAADGTTVADDLKARVLQSVQRYLYMQQVAKDKGYTLSADQKKMIQAEFDKVVNNFDSKKDFNKTMLPYGVDYDELLLFNQIQSLAWQGDDLLFGESGSMKITEESAQKYFQNKFITVQAIFINTQNKTYPNGKVVVLPAEEKKEKEALADSLFARLQQGEAFEAICKEYTDAKEAPENGKYTFEKGGFLNAEAEEKAFSMEENALEKVVTSEGVYLIRRCPLDKEWFQQEKENILTVLEEAKKLSLVGDELAKYELDEDFINNLDIAALPHLA
jgi:hypothetical protein